MSREETIKGAFQRDLLEGVNCLGLAQVIADAPFMNMPPQQIENKK